MNNKIKVVSWNLRTLWNGDGVNSFIHRAGMIYDKIKKEKPDIIAFQEVIAESLEFLKSIMPEYMFLGLMRNENFEEEGVYTAVRKDCFELIFNEGFWMSPTPFVPGSKFDVKGEWPRVCCAAQLRHKATGERIWVYNLHLGCFSEAGRTKEIKCAMGFFDEYNKKSQLPIILLGDFNTTPDSEIIAMCNGYRDIKDITADIKHTFHDFGRRIEECKIDYIFMSKPLIDRIEKVGLWKDELDGIYLSDHYPICAELKIK